VFAVHSAFAIGLEVASGALADALGRLGAGARAAVPIPLRRVELDPAQASSITACRF